jgi:exonuclease VII small subunit
MNSEMWRTEREKLESIIADIEAGNIRLERGQEEYVESLRRRIAHLDDKLTRAY